MHRSAVRAQRDQDRGGEARVQVQDREDELHRAQEAEQQQGLLQLWRGARETGDSDMRRNYVACGEAMYDAGTSTKSDNKICSAAQICVPEAFPPHILAV